MAILNNNPLVGASGNQGGYNINNSLRFRSSASAYLSRTPASNGNQQKFTWSGWVKRGQLSSEQAIIVCRTGSNAAFGRLVFTSGDVLQFFARNSSSTTTALLNTTPVYRDPSAWYHIVLSVDTTQATTADRIKFYVNGNQVTAFSTATYPTQNTNLEFNTTSDTYIGVEVPNAIYLDGYLADVNFIDGQALTPSSFGETDTTTGVWKPKAYTGTYGTNGFYLKFSDIATTSGSNAGLGKDFSGNGNYWTTNNISVTAGTTYDAMTDSPTLTSATVANYAVLNPLWKGSNLTLAGANLNITATGNGGTAISTMDMSSGKYYCEVTINTISDGTIIGIVNSVFNPSLSSPTLSGANAVGYIGVGGDKFVNGTQTAYGASYTTGDIIGIALDITAGTVTFYKNNTSQGAITIGLTGPFYFATSDASSTSNIDQSWNFGQRPFAYTPPTGFVALNTFNLPTPTILQGNKYMDATLYTGNGSSQTITNAAGFRPDLFWAKRRNSAAWHALFDSVRGANSALYSNATNAQDTGWTGQSFTSTGFTVDATYSGETNANTGTFVGWQWQAGQGSTSSNTQGSITSTVSVNTTAGFSIVTYTGTGANATVGHGLGVAPRLIICKNRASATDWAVYHASVGNTGALRLNLQAITETDSRYWNNTTPTSTVFSVGSSSTVNGSSNTQVAYCWAEIAGFSKFGSYTGVSGANSAFVYTGFRPKFVMIKSSNLVGENWAIFDTSRNTYNVTYLELFPNASNAETDGAARGAVLDLLSNGFKIRATNPELNDPAGSYIYMAFAENPTKYALAR